MRGSRACGLGGPSEAEGFPRCKIAFEGVRGPLRGFGGFTFFGLVSHSKGKGVPYAGLLPPHLEVQLALYKLFRLA